MHDQIGRRDFLKKNVTAGVLLGFPFLQGCVPEKGKEPEGKEPTPQSEILALALERMRSEVKPGVVIVVPAQPEQAEVLANDLSYLIGMTDVACKIPQAPGAAKGFVPEPVGVGDSQAHRLFLQAVFVCLSRAEASRAFPDLKADTAAILLDASGKPVEQLAAAPGLFKKEFAERMGRFLHGAKGERLAAAARAQRAALGAEFSAKIDKAVRDLGAEVFETREAATKVLAENGNRCPLLLAKAMTESEELETRHRLVKVFEGMYAASPQEKAGPRLPFGTSWKPVQFDPCPGCGRVAMPAVNRSFLRFIVEKPK